MSGELSCDLRGRVVAVLVDREGARVSDLLRELLISIGLVSWIQHATMMARNTGNTPNRNGMPLNSSFWECVCT